MMEVIKFFFIALFTCSSMEAVRIRKRYKNKNTLKPSNRYKFSRFYNQSNNDEIYYPNEEVFID